MRLRRFVTLRWLKNTFACEEAIEAFIGKYGRGGKPTVHEVVKACWQCGKRSWVLWLLDIVLTPNLYDRWNYVGGDRSTDIRFARLYQKQADAQGKKKRKGKR